jgi:hypothetical protein
MSDRYAAVEAAWAAPDRLQQRNHGTPLDIVTGRMLTDLAQGVALMVVKVGWL